MLKFCDLIAAFSHDIRYKIYISLRQIQGEYTCNTFASQPRNLNGLQFLVIFPFRVFQTITISCRKQLHNNHRDSPSTSCARTCR